jgi:hypothetical protein
MRRRGNGVYLKFRTIVANAQMITLGALWI